MGPEIHRSVTTLPEQVAALDDRARDQFHELFAVVKSRGSLVPPPEMRAWIERSFGSVEAVQTQTIVKTLNRWTLEGSLFNDLRARRPVESKLASAAGEGTAGAGQDPFCHPLTGTPADAFGRVQGQHCVTASNVAKYDALHSVVIFDTHNPLTLSEEQICDAFDTARRWLDQAHHAYPHACYPFVMWNCLPRSGASIVHAHLQVALGEERPYARVELWRQAANRYRQEHGRDYFESLYAAHFALGLAGREGSVHWMAHLTPVKEKEIVLVGDAMDGAIFSLLSRMLRLFIDELGVRAYNVAVYLRPMADVHQDWSDFPVIVRLVDRGDPASATSDVAAMELFAQPVVTFDPWKLAALVRHQFGSDA